MPKRTDISSILIIGAGPIIIGQAAEFDYSGSQAVKALKAEGYRVIVVNSNPATVMTDPDVGAKTFEGVHDRKPTPHELAKLVQRRLEYLPEAVAESQGYKVLPGVPERLKQLSHAGHLLGIITGNGDGAAHIKLQRANLNRWFTFGAYASAGVDRAGIVRRAVERGEAMLGQDVPNMEIYVIGDTPLDIAAAHAVDCTAIAVATGRYDRAALEEAGADHVLDTLEEELPLS